MFNQRTVSKLSSYIFYLSIGLFLVGLLVFFILPVVKEDKSTWVIGTMSNSHKFIEKNCAFCHKDEFKPIGNDSCESCHNVSAHVINKKISNTTISHIEAQSCVSCHLEHSGEKNLIINDDQMCVKCHSGIGNVAVNSTVKNVKTFTNHPEFKYSSTFQTNLKLNHNVHLKKDIRGENGYQTLGCADCHSIKKTGEVIPVDFEKNCRSCHKLDIEYKNIVKEVSHTNSDKVFSEIYREYSASFFDEKKSQSINRIKPGKNYENLDHELEIAKSVILDRSRKSEKEIFLNTGCKLCHEVTGNEKLDAQLNENSSKYEIVWNKEGKSKTSRSSFNHVKHEIVQCESCHADIKKSETFEEHSFPLIKTCHTCHSAGGGATQNCSSCHAYHESNDFGETNKKEISELISGIK